MEISSVQKIYMLGIGIILMCLGVAGAAFWLQNSQAEKLHRLVSSGQTNEVKLLLASGINVDSRGKYGRPPIHTACIRGDKEIVRTLIDAGADINLRGEGGWTPLYAAGVNGHTEVVQLLLSEGADVNASEPKLLAVAARSNDTRLAELVIASGANLNTVGPNNFAPLHLAILEGHAGMVQLLIDSGADVQVKVKGGLSPLNYSVKCGRPAIIKICSEAAKLCSKKLGTTVSKSGAPPAGANTKPPQSPAGQPGVAE